MKNNNTNNTNIFTPIPCNIQLKIGTGYTCQANITLQQLTNRANLADVEACRTY